MPHKFYERNFPYCLVLSCLVSADICLFCDFFLWLVLLFTVSSLLRVVVVSLMYVDLTMSIPVHIVSSVTVTGCEIAPGNQSIILVGK